MADTGFNGGAGYPVHQVVDGNLTAVDVYSNDTYGVITARQFVGDGSQLTNLPISPSSVQWANVTQSPYTADKTGVTDSTATIQTAINAANTAGGGVVYFPAGTYKLTSALTVYSNITLIGDGSDVSVLHQTGSNADGLTGNSIVNFRMNGLWVTGTGAGTGIGLHLTESAGAANEFIHITDCTFYSFGSHGVETSLMIVSQFDRVVCQSNGGKGFYITSASSSLAGTSCVFTACWAQDNALHGWHVQFMVYSTLNSCASDGNGIGYLIDTCQSVNLSACGAESILAQNTLDGTAYKVSGSTCCKLDGCWNFNNKAVAFWNTGDSFSTNILNVVENTPGSGATASIKTDAGSSSSIYSYNVTTATSLGGTDQVMNDSAGNVTLTGEAFVSDVACFGILTLEADGGGSNSSPQCTITTPSISSGTAVTINTDQDVVLYADVKVSSTFSFAMGPTSAAANTIVTSATSAVGLYTFLVPGGWFVKSTFTSADVTWTAQTR